MMVVKKTCMQSILIGCILIGCISLVSVLPANGQLGQGSNSNLNDAGTSNRQIAFLQGVSSGGLERRRADAMSLYQAAQFGLAEEAFRRLCVLEPTVALNHYWVGESCYEQSHYADAMKAFSKSVALSPDVEIAQVRLAEAVLATRNFSQAKDLAVKSLGKVREPRLRERLSSVVRVSSKGLPLAPDTHSRSPLVCETGNSK